MKTKSTMKTKSRKNTATTKPDSFLTPLCDYLMIKRPFTFALMINTLLSLKDGKLTYKPTEEDVEKAFVLDIIVEKAFVLDIILEASKRVSKGEN